jgi:hypothetical protein
VCEAVCAVVSVSFTEPEANPKSAKSAENSVCVPDCVPEVFITALVGVAEMLKVFTVAFRT